ncbi:MAG: amino acid ABC transporter permease, partial [Deltaproteobacteria bacterium]|nr:amino acid ABC transporter permease [Deltaproteobacteria bacterium]
MSAHSEVENIKPPAIDVGLLGWVKNHLFNGALNSIATIIVLIAGAKFLPKFIRWAFIDSVWFTSGKQCHEASGACWSVVTQNIRFNIFGYYPYEQQWRPLVAMIILIVMLIYSRDWKKWNRWLGYS